MKVTCPRCGGKVTVGGKFTALAHDRACPAPEPRGPKTKNEMLALLGPAFEMEEE